VTEGEASKEKMTKRMKGACILMVWGLSLMVIGRLL
jgi:hypothetical protein